MRFDSRADNLSVLSVRERWLGLMDALSFPENLDVFRALTAAYSEKHRHYHTLEHLKSCLAHLDRVSAAANAPAAIALALWFHDAIYKPASSSNEQNSARWAMDFLKGNHAADDFKARVHDLIMVTEKHDQIEGKDQSLMVDIDLTILGAEPEVFDKFESAIRKEYWFVPEFLYRKKRRDVLARFLQKEPVYFNEPFHSELEKQAKSNLRRTIAKL